jgi:amino acid permease
VSHDTSTHKFFSSTLVILGAIFGAGVLGIPYVVAAVGLTTGLLYVVGLGLVVLVLHLMVCELVLVTPEPLQMGGLVRKYVGPIAGTVVGWSMASIGVCAMIAYLVGIGGTGHVLFGAMVPQSSPQMWTAIAWALMIVVVVKGVKTLARMDGVFVSLVFLAVFLLLLLSVPHINFSPVLVTSWRNFFMPYGVILFAFMAISSIATAEEIIPRHPRILRRAVLWASSISIVVYTIFTWTMVSVMGVATPEVATHGVGAYLGPVAHIFGNMFALTAMLGALCTTAYAMRRALEWDLGYPKHIAVVSTVFIPITLIILGVRDFIFAMSIAGAVFGSVNALLICVAYVRALHSRGGARMYHRFGSWSIMMVVLVFALSTTLTLAGIVRSL